MYISATDKSTDVRGRSFVVIPHFFDSFAGQHRISASIQVQI